MTFHRQSVISCVWGVVHSDAVGELPASSTVTKRQSAPGNSNRYRILSRLVQKFRSPIQGVGTGSGHPR